MVNKLKKTTNQVGKASKFFSSVVLTGSLLLFVLKPGISKANDAVKNEIEEVFKKYPAKEIVVQEADQSTKEVAKFEMMPEDTVNALDFAVSNVEKYYPDMKQHLDSLINNFRDQEQRDTVNFLFQQHIFKNITDPQKQVASIIYCIENFVFKGVGISKTFSNTYRISTIVNKIEYANLFNFNKGYNKRFKGYYMKLEQTIITMKEQNEKMKEQNEKMKEQNEKMKEQNEKMKEQNEKMKEQNEKMKEQNEKMKEQNEKMKEQNKQLDKEIEQLELKNQKLKKETEGIINTFTTNDVKNNPQVKKLVLDVEQLYIFAEYEIYQHLAELIEAAKE